ncbi:hypothetical protein WBG78_04995 [Chryseolinea sp. T2]|uniref:hypothetical protein n=1 Tax=Chryseolinea sp. T2 TaxID=3129255 RepID=UPI0030771A37
MDALKELFSSLKERLSSPFIFSFVLSWLIINWRVTVSLLWYDKEQWKDKSLLTFIEGHNNACDFFWYPLLWALIYTFAYPFITMLWNALQTFVTTRTENWQLSISKEAKVPMSKFIEERTKYSEKAADLDKVIAEEKVTRTKLETAEQNNLTLQQEVETAKRQADSFREASNEKEATIRECKDKFELIDNINPLLGTYEVAYDNFTLLIEIDNGVILVSKIANPKATMAIAAHTPLGTIVSHKYNPVNHSALIALKLDSVIRSSGMAQEALDASEYQYIYLFRTENGWRGMWNEKAVIFTSTTMAKSLNR